MTSSLRQRRFMQFNIEKLTLYKGQTVLGIDFGVKRIGLASFKPGFDPYPTPLYQFTILREDQVLTELYKAIINESPDLVIMGLPLYTDGKESEMTKKVREFAIQLTEKISPLPLLLQDETLTSYEAEDRMKNSPQYNFKIDKTKLDALAASIILEDFFKA